jgi:hypothetical protein
VLPHRAGTVNENIEELIDELAKAAANTLQRRQEFLSFFRGNPKFANFDDIETYIRERLDPNPDKEMLAGWRLAWEMGL